VPIITDALNRWARYALPILRYYRPAIQRPRGPSQFEGRGIQGSSLWRRVRSQTGNVNPSILQFLVKPAISRQGGIGQIAIRNSHPLPGGVPAGRGGSHLLFKAP